MPGSPSQIDLLYSERLQHVFGEKLRGSVAETVKSGIEDVGGGVIGVIANAAAAGLNKFLGGVQRVPVSVYIHSFLDPFIAETGKRQFGNHLEPAPVTVQIQSFV